MAARFKPAGLTAVGVLLLADLTQAAGRLRRRSTINHSGDGERVRRARINRARESRSYAGQRYRHGWIPVSPLAVLTADDVDDEYGPVLDSVEVDEGVRVVARERGITIESERGDDIALHAAPSVEDANRWADAIDDRETFSRSSFETEPFEGGVAVRLGDHEVDLDDEQAGHVAQGLRDMAYQVEDLERVPDEPHVDEPPGDETPIPDDTRY